MLGEGQLREQAKKQWERIDVKGRKILNDLLVADKERTVWPENTEPMFTGKKGTKLIKVAFDTKTKRYTLAVHFNWVGHSGVTSVQFSPLACSALWLLTHRTMVQCYT